MRSIINIIDRKNNNKSADQNNQLTAVCTPSPSSCPRVFDLAFESLVKLKDVQELLYPDRFLLALHLRRLKRKN